MVRAVGTLSMAGTTETIDVDIDSQFIPALTEDLNSENSKHDQDHQRDIQERPEADQNTYNTANGSTPSAEQASNPSQRTEEAMDDLRRKIYEAQATNEAFRTQNLALSQRIIRVTRENQEYRQQQLDLITNLQDEIQELKTRVTEIPKGKEGFPATKNLMHILSPKFAENFPRFDV